MAKTAINFNLISEVAPRTFKSFISVTDETFKYHVWDRGINKGWHIAVPSQRVFPHTQTINTKPCKVASIIIGVYDPNWSLKAVDVMSIALITARTYGPRKGFPDTIGAKESSNKKGLFLPERVEDIPVIEGGGLPLKRIGEPVNGFTDLGIVEPCFFEAGRYEAFAVAARAAYGSGQIYDLTPEGEVKIGTKRYQVFHRETVDSNPEGLEKIKVVPIPGTTPATEGDNLPF